MLPSFFFSRFKTTFSAVIIMIVLNKVADAHGTQRQNEHVNHFASQVINYHFDDCFVIRMRKTGSVFFVQNSREVPVVDININESGHDSVLEYFREAPINRVVKKYQRQCIVYYISLTEFETEDLDYLLQAFKIQTLEIEATFSYLIVTEFETNQILNDFITSHKLKNFQHRLWIQGSHVMHNWTYQLKVFCYFCQRGSYGFMHHEKRFTTAVEIKNVDELFPDMTKDFNGKTMRVTAPPAPPLVLITPSKTRPGENEIQGQHANILTSLARQYNFTYTLYSAPGGLTGIKLPNGTWNGIMGEILYDRADIGLSVATSYDRYKIVDNTVSVFYAFIVLVSTKPKPVFEWEAVFYPFKPNCWLAFSISTVFTFFVSKWLHNNAIKYEIPAKMKGRSKDEIILQIKNEFMTNYKSFYITVGQLLEQGTPFDFNATPSRMFVIFWMFFAMIITTAYRSKLFTFLTFPTVEIPPSTFEQLAKSTYKWGMKHLGGIAYVFITKSPLTYVRYVGEKMDIYNDKYTCLDRTFKDRYTCIIYKAYIDYMMEVRYWKIRHNFYVSDFVTPPVGSAWVLPKYAPWLAAFDRVSYPIYEMGLADKYLYDYQVWIAKFIRAKAKASNSTEDIFDLNTNYKEDDGGPKPLEMTNLYAAFFILIFGIIIGGAALVTEICRRNKLKKKIRDHKRRIKIHLRRKIMEEKRQLPEGKRNLPFPQVVKVIIPNTKHIIQAASQEQRKLDNDNTVEKDP